MTSNTGVPQLFVGPHNTATLITDTDTFDIARINFNADNQNIALDISGNVISRGSFDINGNVFIGVTSGSSLGVSNVPLDISSTGNVIVGTTGYFMGTVSTTDIIIEDTMYMGAPDTQGSFKFVREPASGYLRIFLYNTDINAYQLSMRLEHFC
jgi:hypothetical protein